MAKKDLTKPDCREKIDELTNNWKRALADYQNLLKRSEKEKIEFALYANSSLILKLLFVLDYLQKVQSYLQDEGLALAIKEFEKVLTEEGLKEIEALNKPFDPNLMEAVETVEGNEEKVIEVLGRGYLLKDKLLRPAKVKVAVISHNKIS